MIVFVKSLYYNKWHFIWKTCIYCAECTNQPCIHSIITHFAETKQFFWNRIKFEKRLSMRALRKIYITRHIAKNVVFKFSERLVSVFLVAYTCWKKKWFLCYYPSSFRVTNVISRCKIPFLRLALVDIFYKPRLKAR